MTGASGHGELTRDIFDAVGRGDFDLAVALFRPDAVWESEVLEARFVGTDEIRAFMERWSLAYDGFEIEAQDITDYGSGVLLCQFMNRQGPDGDEPPLRFALTVVWRDGLVAHVLASEDLERAQAGASRLAGSIAT